MFIYGGSSPLWLIYDNGCGLFGSGSNAFREPTGRPYAYAEFVGSRHYHWLYPHVIGEYAVDVVIVGNYHGGGYSPTESYGPVAGLFFNQGYIVNAHRVIGSLN